MSTSTHLWNPRHQDRDTAMTPVAPPGGSPARQPLARPGARRSSLSSPRPCLSVPGAVALLTNPPLAPWAVLLRAVPPPTSSPLGPMPPVAWDFAPGPHPTLHVAAAAPITAAAVTGPTSQAALCASDRSTSGLSASVPPVGTPPLSPSLAPTSSPPPPAL